MALNFQKSRLHCATLEEGEKTKERLVGEEKFSVINDWICKLMKMEMVCRMMRLGWCLVDRVNNVVVLYFILSLCPTCSRSRSLSLSCTILSRLFNNFKELMSSGTIRKNNDIITWSTNLEFQYILSIKKRTSPLSKWKEKCICMFFAYSLIYSQGQHSCFTG